ncbi:hypothetical protein KIN20_033623 [Parelaphostrongylus tenuis]|uniref:Uncharacterized protein n=1 Tax=Parelaphostrongylus tenuis TaxID=148309 RepID=A0AAD5R8B5_PARTN|nr:hypothetical protein KIN20_033623 [Parelaphostrongylus tenuis]
MAQTSAALALLLNEYSPLGILCLIMARILETDHLPGTAWTLGLYMLTCITITSYYNILLDITA